MYSFTNTLLQIPPASFMVSMVSKDAFAGFMFAVFSPKNIPVVVAVLISPSLMESSMLFFQLKLLIYCIRFIIRSKDRQGHQVGLQT